MRDEPRLFHDLCRWTGPGDGAVKMGAMAERAAAAGFPFLVEEARGEGWYRATFSDVENGEP